MSLRTSTSRVTEINPVYAMLACTSAEVDLDADVRAFFEECAEQERRPVVQTLPGATLSPLVVGWLRDLAGFWVTTHAGSLREVQTGVAITDPIQLFENTASVKEPGEDALDTSVLTFEALLEHRADGATLLGELVPALLGAAGAASATHWDLVQPMRRPWDPQGLTAHARARMPLAPPVYWSGPDGCGEVAAARTADGVLERVRGYVAHAGTPRSALPRALAVARSLGDARLPVLTCILSAAGAEADLRYRPTAASPERPLVALIGPSTLGRLDLSADALIARHGGERVGRARLPGVVVPFDTDDLERARRAYLDLVTTSTTTTEEQA